MVKVLTLDNGALVMAESPADYVQLIGGKMVVVSSGDALALNAGKRVTTTLAINGYPDEDLDNTGGYTPSAGSLLFEMIDETVTPSDSDYIYSPGLTEDNDARFEVGISNCAGDGTATVRVRLKSDAGDLTNMEFAITVWEGGSTIVGSAGGTCSTGYNNELVECSGISDYTTLSVQVILTCPHGEAGPLVGYCSWIQVDTGGSN